MSRTRALTLLAITLIALGVAIAIASGYRRYQVTNVSVLNVSVPPSTTRYVAYPISGASIVSLEYFSGVSCSIRVLPSFKEMPNELLNGLDCESTTVYLRIPRAREGNLTLVLSVQNFSDEEPGDVGIRVSEYVGLTPYAYLSIAAFLLWIFGIALMLKVFTAKTLGSTAKS